MEMGGLLFFFCDAMMSGDKGDGDAREARI
jgi:hypothetical protein